MAVFVQGFQALAQMGLLDSLLPFLLIFMIMYVASTQVQLFKNNPNISTLLAIIIALMVVIPHITGTYPAGTDVVDIINSAFPHVSIVVVAAVALLMLIGVFGLNFNVAGSGVLSFIVVIASVITVVYIFGQSAGWWVQGNTPAWLGFLNDAGTQAVIIVIAVFLIVLALMRPKTEGAKFGEVFGKITGDIKNAFGKGP